MFICPKCGGDWFKTSYDGLSSLPSTKVTRICKDRNGIGCKWQGPDSECMHKDTEKVGDCSMFDCVRIAILDGHSEFIILSVPANGLVLALNVGSKNTATLSVNDNCEVIGQMVFQKVNHDKPEMFKQANPRDQLTAILSSVEGNVDNMREGIKSDDAYARIMLHLQQLKTLGNWFKSHW